MANRSKRSAAFKVKAALLFGGALALGSCVYVDPHFGYNAHGYVGYGQSSHYGNGGGYKNHSNHHRARGHGNRGHQGGGNRRHRGGHGGGGHRGHH